MVTTTKHAPIPASPTKRFFVEMLTRDIELQDAILDLLDNCVDGIQRSHKKNLQSEKPYEGFWAKINFNERKFQIIDNCGGIPLEIAEKYAFMMGRPEKSADDDLPTVGMYGIGMKRAIFKMGQQCRVVSHTKAESFEVTISPQWMVNDDWNLPLNLLEKPLHEPGTLIDISHIRESIQKIFSETSPFQKNLRDLISQHYSYIIEKGFKVFVNDEEVRVKQVSLLWDKSAQARLAPYLYQANLDGVDVKLAVGFYTPMLKEDELDEEQQTRRSKEDAGWTIMCNDRVVVFNDKTRLTGWGEAGVPNYHSQFIGITGVVYFQSNDAWKLPITTTKRGVDTSSELYLYVKDFMREGLKKFTNYTNQWKIDNEGEKEISASATAIKLEEIFSIDPNAEKEWSKVKNRPNEFKLNIPLATPAQENPRKQIKFTRPFEEIQLLAKYLFDDIDAKPGEVGEECFEQVLKKARTKA